MTTPILSRAKEVIVKGEFAQFSGIAFASYMIPTQLISLYKAVDNINRGDQIELLPQADGTYHVRRARA